MLRLLETAVAVAVKAAVAVGRALVAVVVVGLVVLAVAAVDYRGDRWRWGRT